MQASLGIQALELFARRSGSSMVVLAGDLASPPASPAYQFIARGELSKEVLHKLKEQSKVSERAELVMANCECECVGEQE